MVTNKTVKASLFTLILAFIVIGTVAIAGVMKKGQPVEVKQVMVMETWYFQGGNPLLAQNYSKDLADARLCEAPFQTICTIEAPSNGNQPDLSASIDGKTVEDHIQDALDALPSSTPPENPVVSGYRATN